MKDSYEDEEEEVEGPKSSFSTYVAEGDALYKQGEFKKANESYSLVGPPFFHSLLMLLHLVECVAICDQTTGRGMTMMNFGRKRSSVLVKN